jgi:hypothetical protein
MINTTSQVERIVAYIIVNTKSSGIEYIGCSIEGEDVVHRILYLEEYKLSADGN